MFAVEAEAKGKESTRTTWPLFFQGAARSLPIAVSAMVDGMVFGMLAQQAGVHLWEIMLFSLLVNAGSSQFAALGFVAQGVIGWPILVSTFMLNARHLLYGITLGPSFRNQPPWKLSLMAAQLSDESYAILANYLAEGNRPSFGYFFGASFTDYAVWNVATLLGGVFGSFITDPARYGLDFAFTATFLGFLASQLLSRFYVVVAIVSGALACVGYWLGGTTAAVLVGTIAAILMGVFSREPQ